MLKTKSGAKPHIHRLSQNLKTIEISTKCKKLPEINYRSQWANATGIRLLSTHVDSIQWRKTLKFVGEFLM